MRRVIEDDWAQLRDLRLEMLADAPKAYLETLPTALSVGEAEWRSRARRGSAGNENAAFAAEAGIGRWVGMLAVFVDAPGLVHLVSVYVAPAHRGRHRGVAELLFDTALCWGGRDAAGAQRAHLWVHEHNLRARRFYERIGFELTGATKAYPLDLSENELEMSRPLSGPSGTAEPTA